MKILAGVVLSAILASVFVISYAEELDAGALWLRNSIFPDSLTWVHYHFPQCPTAGHPQSLFFAIGDVLHDSSLGYSTFSYGGLDITVYYSDHFSNPRLFGPCLACYCGGDTVASFLVDEHDVDSMLALGFQADTWLTWSDRIALQIMHTYDVILNALFSVL